MYTMIPYGGIRRMNQLLDEMEQDIFHGDRTRQFDFPADITDCGSYYLLEAELPGFQKENMDLEIKDGILTISAVREEQKEEQQESGKYLCRERRMGRFYRSFRLTGIQEDAVSATYEDGVLTMTLPKAAELESDRKKIAIT